MVGVMTGISYCIDIKVGFPVYSVPGNISGHYCELQMFHRMASPDCIIDISETEGGVETFGIGIALIYQ